MSQMTIKAAVLTEPGQPLQLETLHLDDPHEGEVRVRVVAAGVCHSDYHVVNGTTHHPMPCVVGHEGAGVVESVGPGVTHIQPGDHVTLSWTPDCGNCFYCRRGQPNLCETYTEPIWNGVMLDGTTRLHRPNGDPVYLYSGLGVFSEYIVVPQQSCIPIRQDVSLQATALVGCAVATGVGAVLYTATVRAGESVVVYGAGGIGLNIIQGARLAGATTIISVDVNDYKAQLARDFGATHTLISGTDTLDEIRALTDGRGADHVFESVGLPELQETALEAVRPGGMLTLVGLSPMGSGTNLPGAVITRTEKTIRGSYYGSVSPQRDFPLMIEMYRAGRLNLDDLITQHYSLDEINQAFDAMLSGAVGRGIIVFD